MSKHCNLLPTAVFFAGFLVLFVLLQSYEIHRLRKDNRFLKELIIDYEHNEMIRRVQDED